MRVAILAHDKFSPEGAKTGNSLLRYAHLGWSQRYAATALEVPVPTQVVAVIDVSKAGRDAGDVVGEHAKGVPIVASLQEALAYDPEALAIGIAPVGGQLPDAWRPDLRAALENGLAIVNGLHAFVSDDAELAGLAQKTGARIHDVRRFPRARHRIATGEGALVDALVVTHVGTDCSSGKMTTAIELTREARARGLRAAFVATGQTGIMVGCDAGAPLDAITSDFVAGAVEACVLHAAKSHDLIFVEGQGAITHPAYSGVTCSLLHGSFPDLLVMSHEPARKTLRFPSALAFRTNPLPVEIELNERLLAPTTQGKVAAISLITRDGRYAEAVAQAAAETGLPAGDVFRDDAPKLLDAVLARAEAMGLWSNGKVVPGEKRRRRTRAA